MSYGTSPNKTVIGEEGMGSIGDLVMYNPCLSG